MLACESRRALVANKLRVSVGLSATIRDCSPKVDVQRRRSGLRLIEGLASSGSLCISVFHLVEGKA